jgi:hypothetical protein
VRRCIPRPLQPVVERNRGTVSYGILIQRAPLEKHIHGDVGGEPMRLGGGQGHEGQGAGSDPGPATRGCSGLLATVPGRKTAGEQADHDQQALAAMWIRLTRLKW